jgi:hypothetical protein
MSFSMEVHAANKPAALAKIKEAYLPEPVRAFLNAAVENLKSVPEGSSRAIYIKAMGHLHASGDYELSSADLQVRPIPLAG